MRVEPGRKRPRPERPGTRPARPCRDGGILAQRRLARALQASDAAATRQHIDAAVESAGTLTPARWRLLPPALAMAETARIAGIVAHWIETCERPRPAFDVAKVEWSLPLNIAGLTLTLKLDRVDAWMAAATRSSITRRVRSTGRPRGLRSGRARRSWASTRRRFRVCRRPSNYAPSPTHSRSAKSRRSAWPRTRKFGRT
jgi:hypothetical protein